MDKDNEISEEEIEFIKKSLEDGTMEVRDGLILPTDEEHKKKIERYKEKYKAMHGPDPTPIAMIALIVLIMVYISVILKK